MTLDGLCVRIARRVGEQIWKRFGVPVYFYEAAARGRTASTSRNLRRGQFEGLREEVQSQSRPPARHRRSPRCIRPRAPRPSAPRKFLIAYNINLATPDVEIAPRIAR